MAEGRFKIELCPANEGNLRACGVTGMDPDGFMGIFVDGGLWAVADEFGTVSPPRYGSRLQDDLETLAEHAMEVYTGVMRLRLQGSEALG